MINVKMLVTAFAICLPVLSGAQGETTAKPEELELLKAYVGVWDAEIEVWMAGPDSPPTSFTAVETNRAYGEYWIASDFDSEFMGETVRVHSIIGYDLDKETLVGTIIDHGPYSASMTGEYDAESRTARWTTEAKAPNGQPMTQYTTITQDTADERMLVLSVPGETDGEFTKFMRIKFIRRDE